MSSARDAVDRDEVALLRFKFQYFTYLITWNDYGSSGSIDVSGIAPSETLGYKVVKDTVVKEPNLLVVTIPGDL